MDVERSVCNILLGRGCLQEEGHRWLSCRGPKILKLHHLISMTKLLGIWPSTARQFLMLIFAGGYVRPAAEQPSSLCLTLPVQHVRPSPFPLLVRVRLSGTHCLKTCGIRRLLWTITDSHWRHFYFRSTSVFSTLEVSCKNALYKFTFDIDIDQ